MRKLLFFLSLFFTIAFSSRVLAQKTDVNQITADGYFDGKNYQQAYENYTKAIKSAGHDKINLSILYSKRGQSLYHLEKFDDAIKDYTTAIDLNPYFVDAYWRRAIVYQHIGNYTATLNDYNTAISLVDSTMSNVNKSILYLNLAHVDLQLQDYPAAFKADSISISFNEQNAGAIMIRGDINMALKKYDIAVQDFSTAMYGFKNDINGLSFAYEQRADAKSGLKHYKDAINDYTMAININPDNASAYWNRAGAYHYNSDYELASADYTKAMLYHKGDNVNLSKLYGDRAENEAQETLLTKAIQDDSLAIALDPTNMSAYFSKAFAYTQNSDYQLSIDVYNNIMKLTNGKDKVQSIIYYELANNEYFLNHFDNVITDCTKSIALNPGYSEPYYYRGKVYLKKMNNKELADKDFNQAVALDTTKQTVGYIFSLLYLGRADEAVNVLQSNLLGTTDNSIALSDYYNLACLYSLMNKPDEANIYLKKAIDSGYEKKYAMKDEDLDNIRNTDDYKAIMADKPVQ